MRRDVIVCPKVPQPIMGSHAVRAGDFVFVGGQIASDYQSGLASEVKEAEDIPHPIVSAKLQSDYILKSAQAILKAAGSSLRNGVRIDQFCTRPDAASPYLETRRSHIAPEIRPASTHVQIESLLIPRALVALELIAVTNKGKTKKEIVSLEDIPKSPGGPFAGGPQAVRAGDFVFLTGQVASDFQTGVVPEARRSPDFWYGSAIKLQTEYVLNRLKAVVEASGSSLENVVKADVYLTNIEDYYEFEEVWGRYFPRNPPARTLIPVSRIADVGCVVEINMIALREGGKVKIKTVSARDVPPPCGHQPHAISAGDFVFLSGLYATDSENEIAAEARLHPEMPWFGSSGKKQTACILKKMEKICRAAGSDLRNVAWTQNFYVDLSEFQPSLDIWQTCFPKAPPASFVCAVKRPHLIPDCTILVDAVALISR
ncbi:MAG: RidA family protein [Nitrospinota bacterium]